MSVRAHYELENNILDSSGNGYHGTNVGAGPTFSQTDPLPIRNSYLSRFNPNNAVNLPTAVFSAGMETMGSAKVTFFADPGSTKTLSLNMLLYGLFSGGDFWVHTHARDIEVKIPTAAGGQVFKTGTAVLQWGKWYDVYIIWTSAPTLKVYLNDVADGFQRLLIDVVPASIPKFGSCSTLWIGNLPANPGAWNTDSPIDNVSFFDTEVIDDSLTNADERQFLSVGHSIVEGYNVSIGYREEAYAHWKSKNLHYNFCGDYVRGSEVMSAHSGIGGNTTANVDSRITALLTLIYPNPGIKQYVILGPTVTNDTTAGTALVTVKNNLESIINKIETYAPTMKIFLVTDPIRTTVPTNVDDYNEKIREIYNTHVRKDNGIYLIDVYTQSISLADGLHPDQTGYDAMGLYIAQEIDNILNPPVPPVPVIPPKIVPVKGELKDVAITWDADLLGGVISFDLVANDLISDNGLSTAVYISLFTDARARDDDALPDILYSDDFPNRRGWWADFSSERADDSVGSRLWLLNRSKSTAENLRLAEGYAREALQWLIDEKIASKVNCRAEVGGTNNSFLFLYVKILKYSGESVSYRFESLWKEELSL